VPRWALDLPGLFRRRRSSTAVGLKEPISSPRYFAGTHTPPPAPRRRRLGLAEIAEETVACRHATLSDAQVYKPRSYVVGDCRYRPALRITTLLDRRFRVSISAASAAMRATPLPVVRQILNEQSERG